MASSLNITAIIPTYNRADYLHESIMSVLGQTRVPDQIIVVDDGSTDQTSASLARFGNKIQLLTKDNGGKSSALNLALKHARGDAIWIMDDDDIAVIGALELMEARLASDVSLGYVFGDYDNFTTADSVKDYTPGNRREFDLDSLFFSGLIELFAFQPAMLVRKSCFDVVGSFDEGLARAQDYDMLLRLSAKFRASYISSVIFHQRQHVGARGPAHDRIDGSRVWDLQGKYDRMCVAKAIEQQPLAAFTSWSKKQISASPAEEIRALLLRSYIKLLRLRDSNAAAEDIIAAAAIARQHVSGNSFVLVPNEDLIRICRVGARERSDFTNLVSVAETAPKAFRKALLRSLIIARTRRIAGMLLRREVSSTSKLASVLTELGYILLKARLLI